MPAVPVCGRRLSEVPPPIVRFRRERRRRNVGPTNVKCSGDVTSNAWLSVLAIFQCFVSFFFVMQLVVPCTSAVQREHGHPEIQSSACASVRVSGQVWWASAQTATVKQQLPQRARAFE